MACSSSISTTPSPHKLTFHTFPSKLPSSSSSSPIPKFSILTCHCHNNSNNNGSSSSSWRWDSAMQDTFSSLVKRFDSFLNSTFNQQNINTHDRNEQKQEEEEEEDWDWERWQQHFAHVDEQERIVSLLKSQLGNAIDREDFEDASSFKVALAAAAANDSVGRAILHLNRAIEEERYEDAAILRDNAGAGLVGWWAGISKDKNDPYGRIIHITAEHGRYLARSFSPRQLATDLSGAPVFEVFLTVNKKGEYKQQAVYLKRGGHSNPRVVSSKTPGTLGNLNQVKSTEEENGVISSSSDTDDDDDGDSQDDDSDIAAGQSGFQDILSDMIPGLKVKVLKVTGQGKADRDTISKVIEEIVEEESEDEDFEVENVESEDESLDEVKQEKDKIEVDAANGIFGSDKPKEIAVKLVIGGLSKKPPSSVSNKDLLRVPAKLEKKGRRSFSFSIEQEVKQEDPGSEDKSLSKRAKLVSQRAIDNVMFDIAKVIGREKIPVKVLKDVGDLINLTMSQAKNQEPLSGSTTFNRIEIPRSSDPLNGLYIGAQGIYTSEVIQLRRKYGQWQEDSGAKNSSNLEFYEYVEALKITGDPYVPAGQVAFRAKVGKRYQLPHKGIIPEEFGVIARYKGQGRLAEPGFRNPRWVDGELVILDGKYIKGGPVVGFVYWAPEYQFLVFFNRLRLQ